MFMYVVLWVTFEVWSFDINVAHVLDICITEHRIRFWCSNDVHLLRYTQFFYQTSKTENSMFGAFSAKCRWSENTSYPYSEIKKEKDQRLARFKSTQVLCQWATTATQCDENFAKIQNNPSSCSSLILLHKIGQIANNYATILKRTIVYLPSKNKFVENECIKKVLSKKIKKEFWTFTFCEKVSKSFLDEAFFISCSSTRGCSWTSLRTSWPPFRWRPRSEGCWPCTCWTSCRAPAETKHGKTDFLSC